MPLLIVTPLVFLGGSFYSISMLPPVWQTISMFNPVVYLISGFRWAFFGIADVPVAYRLLQSRLFGTVPAGRLLDFQNRLAHPSVTWSLSDNFCSAPLFGGWPIYMGLNETLDPFLKSEPTVAVIRLQGVIAAGARRVE